MLKTFLDGSSCFVVMVFKLRHEVLQGIDTFEAVIYRVLAFVVVGAGVLLDEIVLEAVSFVVSEVRIAWEVAFVLPLRMSLRNVVRRLTMVFLRLILR